MASRSPRPILLMLALCLLAACRGESSGVLFYDRFGNPNSGWGSESRESYDRGYQEGEYFIEVYDPDWFVWTGPGKRFGDVVIAADARRVSGAPGGHFGLICRYRAPASFYYFAITDDGYYAIMRVRDRHPKILSGAGFLPSSEIPIGAAVYHLRAVCQGERLQLFVNDQLIASVADPTFQRGDVGLGVGSGPQGSIRVHFDNFKVIAPEEEP
ncbi:MAG: hypothetical protein N0A03_05835 [Anaerolineae bacterium]|nr:hypothetical protein [Anaerolineae bacterium]